MVLCQVVAFSHDVATLLLQLQRWSAIQAYLHSHDVATLLLKLRRWSAIQVISSQSRRSYTTIKAAKLVSYLSNIFTVMTQLHYYYSCKVGELSKQYLHSQDVATLLFSCKVGQLSKQYLHSHNMSYATTEINSECYTLPEDK
jgi:hypothetical protein